MRIKNLGGFRTVDEYVTHKLNSLRDSDRSFHTLYDLFFSERENTLFEWDEGYRQKKITYGECREEIEKLAPGICRRLSEFQKGRPVGLLLENGPLWIECYWAILRAGYCPLLMNARLGKDALEEVLHRADACAVLSSGEKFSLPTFSPDEIDRGQPALDRDAPFGDTFFFMSSGTSAKVKVCAYSAKELSAMSGLAPRIKESGSSVHSSYMSRKSSGRLRQILYMDSLFGVKNIPVLQEFHQRLLEKGKKKMTVRCACMRKMLLILRSIVVHQMPYRPYFSKKGIESI